MRAKNAVPKRGAEAFEAHYSEAWQERWASLREALLAEPNYHEFVRGAGRPYYMNLASVLIVEALGIDALAAPYGLDVLDMCAAPGGKSLLLADALFPLDAADDGAGACAAPPSSLTLNDLSRSRSDRLRRVFADSFGFDERINFWVGDASTYGMRRPESYDLIVLDAPCSSEGHVLSHQGEMANWSPSRIKRNAQTQHALLCSAWDALKPGATLMYATCSIAERENDGAVAGLCKKRDGVEVLSSSPRADARLMSIAEKTAYGWMLLPDHEPGVGPLFVAYIRKNA